jgi:hypothetical protein
MNGGLGFTAGTMHVQPYHHQGGRNRNPGVNQKEFQLFSFAWEEGKNVVMLGQHPT